IEGNFNMVRQWLGDTVHVHNIGGDEYPFQQLFNLFAGIKYTGWILLEESTNPPDKITALKDELIRFNNMAAKAYKKYSYL
ncbi:MAG: sugar phosphate isomerase/epimerase, partial [Ginsengibacter sp.]